MFCLGQSATITDYYFKAKLMYSFFLKCPMGKHLYQKQLNENL